MWVLYWCRPSEKPSEEQLKEVHRRLMKLNHPDLGGSPMIAAKVNEAKELLMKEESGGSSKGGEY